MPGKIFIGIPAWHHIPLYRSKCEVTSWSMGLLANIRLTGERACPASPVEEIVKHLFLTHVPIFDFQSIYIEKFLHIICGDRWCQVKYFPLCDPVTSVVKK